jgi:cell division protein FtsB
MSNLIRNTKAVNKIVFAGVIVVFFIAITTLGFIMSNRIDALQTEKTSLQSQITALQFRNIELENTYQNLQSNFSNLVSSYNQINASYAQLNEQYYLLLATTPSPTVPSQPAATPKLISLGMQYTDNRTDLNAPFLIVTGYVVNVGSSTANDCTINVSAVQNGNSTAIDTSAPIKTLESGTYQKIDLHFPYTGQPIIAYSANLKWSP